MLLGIESTGNSLANTAQSVGSRVLDVDVRVIHHTNKSGQSLLNDGVQDMFLRSLHDSTKCGNGCVPVVPILRADVLLNERENGRHDSASDTLCPQLQTLVCGAGHVV